MQRSANNIVSSIELVMYVLGWISGGWVVRKVAKIFRRRRDKRLYGRNEDC